MKETTNPALENEALYAKSKVYIGRGLRAQSDEDVEEYQLWSSLALELLGKAALAKVHPALVADPTHSHSLFAACGRQLSPDIKTITAKTLFERLGHIDKAFDSRHQKFCEQMAIRRNSELHSGESPFSGIAADAWEKEYWGAIETVLKMQNESLESWLGAENSKAPSELIEQAREALEWAIKHRIVRCKEDFEKKYQDPILRAKRIEESKTLRWWNVSRQFNLSADWGELNGCPACTSMGFQAGALWSEDVSDEVDPDDPSVEYVDEVYVVEEFICPTCGLHLYGSKETSAAKLPEEFTLREIREREFGPDYGND